MKQFDLIAFDLDGTLAKSKTPVVSEMAELLLHLCDHYEVAVISGAAFAQFETQFLSHLKLSGDELLSLHILPTNGASMCEYYEGSWSCTHDRVFSPEEKQKIISAMHTALAAAHIEKPEKLYGEQIEDRETQITFSALGQNAPVEEKQKWDPEHAKRAVMVAAMKPLLSGFSIHIGGATSVDVTREGIDKAYGLKRLLNHLHLAPEKMLYVGDELFPDGNDAPALTVGCATRQVAGPEEAMEVIRSLLAETDE